uniref:Tubulin-specific chaperone A n=1 Tax=Syphacia muris TaxID=451379 RepID=A0A0N5AJA5_9BILA
MIKLKDMQEMSEITKTDGNAIIQRNEELSKARQIYKKEIVSEKEDCDDTADCVDDLMSELVIIEVKRLRGQLADSKQRVVQLGNVCCIVIQTFTTI